MQMTQIRIMTFLAAAAFARALLAPTEAGAHPHVFIDTGITLIMDDQSQLTGVEVTWVYDDFYSLLILQDMGLDEDADGVLTPTELERVAGWDMKWDQGYEGDLYIHAPDATPIALSGPTPITTKVIEGQLVSVHRRDLETPVPGNGLTVRAYDPEFYTAYDLTGGILMGGEPADCHPAISRPDEDAAYKEAQQVMSEFQEDAIGVPLLGHVFAETVTLQCTPAN